VGLKKTFLLAVSAAAFMAGSPARAFDGAQTIFYISIPLDRPASAMSFGMRLQGSRAHEAVDIDARMLRFVSVGGIEAQWLLAGALAVAAAAAIGGHKRAEQQAAAAPQPRAPQAPQPCPQTCN
jgi:hypothetical protein